MMFDTGNYSTLDSRSTRTHLRWNGRNVCGRNLPGTFTVIAKWVDEELISCANCRSWLKKNAKKIATGEYK
jgi:hypothetical protein